MSQRFRPRARVVCKHAQPRRPRMRLERCSATEATGEAGLVRAPVNPAGADPDGPPAVGANLEPRELSE
eukprot:9014992-Lingulodinium_polyedra.AAC.1